MDIFVIINILSYIMNTMKEEKQKLDSLSEDGVHIQKLKNGDVKSFDFLFDKYYEDLVFFGYTFLKEQESCEDVVQDIFMRLWENRENIHICGSLKAYLMTAVKNKSLELLKHKDVIKNHQDYVICQNNIIDYDAEKYLLYSELNRNLYQEINKLPEDVKVIFKMHRFKNKKYNEIADELNVSVRTVENKISKALEILRKRMEAFYSLILLFLPKSMW